jgi:hypothetical protein
VAVPQGVFRYDRGKKGRVRVTVRRLLVRGLVGTIKAIIEVSRTEC